MVLKHGGKAEFDALLALYDRLDAQDEKVAVLRSLGASLDPAVHQAVVDFAMGDKVGVAHCSPWSACRIASLPCTASYRLLTPLVPYGALRFEARTWCRRLHLSQPIQRRGSSCGDGFKQTTPQFTLASTRAASSSAAS